MTALYAVGAFIAVYLLLLARSAWQQGEFRQFLFSLVVVATVVGAIAAIIVGYGSLMDWR